MWYLGSTFLINFFMLIEYLFEDQVVLAEGSLLNSVIEYIYGLCLIFRICLTDCVFLRPASDPQLDTTRLITHTVTVLVCLGLMYLATLIYKKSAKTVIKIFAVLVFLDFIASIIFMIYTMWLALSLKAVLIILLLLSMGSAETQEIGN